MLRIVFYLIIITVIPTLAIADVVNCKTDRKKGEIDHCKQAVAGDTYQCTTYVQQQLPWVGHLGISLNEKKGHKYYKDKNKTQACVGGVAVVDAGSYGHVGIVVANLGNEIRIRDRNYCCDGVDRVHDIPLSQVAGDICQDAGIAQKEPPTPPSRKVYKIRITNIDDHGECQVNGHKAASANYYGDTGWKDISDKLHNGENEIEFKVKNEKGGFTYYFGFMENDQVKWEKSCGKVGSKGCDEHLSKDKTLTKKIKVKL